MNATFMYLSVIKRELFKFIMAKIICTKTLLVVVIIKGINFLDTTKFICHCFVRYTFGFVKINETAC
jgi:hypothetical protein